jgi:DNA-binding transcriptional LysR family regulator
LRLAFRSPTPDGAGRALREGTVDLQIGPPVLGERVERRKLYLENYQVVGRRLPSARLTLEDYVAADHLLVTMDGSFHGVVDIALGAMGLERRVVASAPNFLAALAIVAESDVLLTAPTRLARTHAGRFGLARLPPPLEVGGYEVAISRARRERPDPCLDWLCEAIAQIACGAPPLPS